MTQHSAPRGIISPIGRGLDYSAGRIDGAVIKAAGYSFVIRYIDDPQRPLNSKHIRPVEYQDLVGAGLSVYLVFEVNTTDTLAGFAGGVLNAKRALAGASWIGYPPDQPIFFASDMHLTSGQLRTALGYIDGVSSVLGDSRVGIYGFWELIDAAIALNKGVAYWQAGIAPDPSDPVHVWQRNDGTVQVGGVACDVNELLRPLPTTPIGGEDMSPDEHAMLVALYQYVSGSATVVPQGESWPGWQTWPGGTDEHLSATDYLRRTNVQLTAIAARLDALTAAPDGPAAGSLSQADVNRIAGAVVSLFSQKLMNELGQRR